MRAAAFFSILAYALSLTDTLDALDELMGSEAVQIGVAEVEWKNLLRSMGARTPARYSGLVGDSSAGRMTPLRLRLSQKLAGNCRRPPAAERSM